MKGFVLYSEEYGVYLGSFMGMGFWSKLDPAGQTSAVMFADEASIQSFILSLDNPSALPEWYPVEVEAAGEYATIDECVKAGLPSWKDALAPRVSP